MWRSKSYYKTESFLHLNIFCLQYTQILELQHRPPPSLSQWSIKRFKRRHFKILQLSLQICANLYLSGILAFWWYGAKWQPATLRPKRRQFSNVRHKSTRKAAEEKKVATLWEFLEAPILAGPCFRIRAERFCPKVPGFSLSAVPLLHVRRTSDDF